jgi:hypothetical protein
VPKPPAKKRPAATPAVTTPFEARRAAARALLQRLLRHGERVSFETPAAPPPGKGVAR